MKLIKDEVSFYIIADERKRIRDINDIYKETILDEEGNIIEEEHTPYYMYKMYVPDSFTEEMMNELYVEEIEEDAINEE